MSRLKTPEQKAKLAEYQRDYRQRNLEKLRAYDRARAHERRRDPEAARASARAYQRKHRLARYGTSEVEVQQTFAAQGRACAICKEPLTFEALDGRRRGTAHVDHDHELNVLRGVLCSGCNVGIAALGDTATGVMRAHHYLAKTDFSGVSEGWLH